MTASKDHVVSGLIAKRRELARIINELQQQLDQHWADLTHIDGTLRVLGAEPQPQALRPRHAYRRTRYFGHNEVSRLVLNILRIASREPIGIEEISRRIVIAKGFDPEDANLRAAIRQHVRPAITRLHKQGVIEGVSGGRGSKWKLAAI